MVSLPMIPENSRFSDAIRSSDDIMDSKPKVWYKREPLQYLMSIGAGLGAGIALNVFGASDDVITLSTLPGNLFLRALQCAVIPVSNLLSSPFRNNALSYNQMIFFNIASSVASIFGSGGSGSLGSKAIILYSVSTVLAITQGILAANAYSFLFQSDVGDTDDDDGVKVSFACPKDFGVMTTTEDGNLLCVHHNQLSAYNLTSS